MQRMRTTHFSKPCYGIQSCNLPNYAFYLVFDKVLQNTVNNIISRQGDTKSSKICIKFQAMLWAGSFRIRETPNCMETWNLGVW